MVGSLSVPQPLEHLVSFMCRIMGLRNLITTCQSCHEGKLLTPTTLGFTDRQLKNGYVTCEHMSLCKQIGHVSNAVICRCQIVNVDSACGLINFSLTCNSAPTSVCIKITPSYRNDLLSVCNHMQI